MGLPAAFSKAIRVAVPVLAIFVAAYDPAWIVAEPFVRIGVGVLGFSSAVLVVSGLLLASLAGRE